MYEDYYAIPRAINIAQKAVVDANDLMVGKGDEYRASVQELFRAFDHLQAAWKAEIERAEAKTAWDLQAEHDKIEANHCH